VYYTTTQEVKQMSDNDRKWVEGAYQKELIGYVAGAIPRAQFTRLAKLELVEGTALRPKLTFKGRMVAHGVMA
jgi:hypothetical protein